MTDALRRTRGRIMVLVAMLSVSTYACIKDGQQRQPRREGAGVPAPAVALTEQSPVEDFLRYGDSLQFAVDSPGSIHVTRLVNGDSSTVRVRSELRLPSTADTAYATGRIIARWETLRAPSRFGVPVGVAYLYVKGTPRTGFKGRLYYRAYLTGAVGVVDVFQRHTPRGTTVGLLEAFCEDEGRGDTSRVCCLCGGGMYNCTSNVDGGSEQ